MRLIASSENKEARVRAEIFEMDASGYTVFITRDDDLDSKESFVFDSESDAQSFAGRVMEGRP